MATSQVTTLRCSSLDKLFKCTPSVLHQDPSLIRVSIPNDASELGKVVHALAADFVDEGEYDIRKRCTDAGVPDSEYENIIELMSYVVRSWEELSQYFPDHKTECVVESGVLDVGDSQYKIAGTVDVLSPIGTSNGIFVDWKSGYIDDGYHHQMAGYAYSIWCILGRPASCTITGIIVFLRHHYYRVVKYDATRLSQWEYDLVHNVIPKTDVFRPDKQCNRCELYASCPARKAMVESTIDTMLLRNKSADDPEYLQFLDDARDLISGLTVENKDDPAVARALTMLLHRVSMITQASDNAKALIRDAVERVGNIRIDDNTELTLKEVAVRKVNPARAIKVLRRHLSDAELCESMKLSLPRLLHSYASHARKGQKYAAKSQLTRELERANAINITNQHRLEEIDVSNPDGEPENG